MKIILIVVTLVIVAFIAGILLYMNYFKNHSASISDNEYANDLQKKSGKVQD